MIIDMSTTTQGKALEYLLTKGYSVIPVGDNKRPLIKWEEFQNRLPTIEEVEGWWEKFPNASVGIVTGKISGLTVIDIDVKEKPTTPLDTFPLTYTVQTKSGGWHLYYEYSDSVGTCANQYKDYPHVDIRNDGGYVVAPPSEGYEVVESCCMDVFPTALFVNGSGKGSSKKKTFSMADVMSVESGGRNDSITKMIGSFLAVTQERKWKTEVWKAIVKANKTYEPPLSERELKTTFESIAKKEIARREQEEGSVASPIQVSDVDQIKMRMRGTQQGFYKDLTNAVFALSSHSDWSTAFRYDTFTQSVLFNGVPMEDHDVLKAQQWLQKHMELNGISRKIVEDAVEDIAHRNSFNSAEAWLRSLEWDGVKRLDEWIPMVYGVDNDEYHQKVGSNWLRAAVKRVLRPGSKFDHVLVVQGGQGVRKTTSFAALGGPYHVETAIHAGSKDFLMQFVGKIFIEFSEGETLSRSETKQLKALITRTHDKYRPPYGRRDVENPRMCVFCMTTNDTEFLKDETGNRRWWIVRMPRGAVADSAWLEDNREQLFAEAVARVDEDTWEVPAEEALRHQEASRIVDSLEEKVVTWYGKLSDSKRDNGVTVQDFHDYIYADRGDMKPELIEWRFEQKVKNVFGGTLGLSYTQRRREGERVRRWFGA